MYKQVWLIAAVTVTLSFGALYVAVQQSLRLGANDPQTSIALDTAAALSQDLTPSNISSDHVEMADSMASFVIIYDQLGNVVDGNGYLDGKIPSIPLGALQHTPARGTHAVTWQPRAGVRIASVSARAGNYYVLSGRSLSVVENHIETFTTYIAGVWLLVLVAGGAAYLFVNRPVADKKG